MLLLKARSQSCQWEKRQRQLEKTIDHSESRIAELQSQLKSSDAENRTQAQESNRLRAELEDAQTECEASRRENKKLTGKSAKVYSTAVEGN